MTIFKCDQCGAMPANPIKEITEIKIPCSADPEDYLQAFITIRCPNKNTLGLDLCSACLKGALKLVAERLMKDATS